MEEIWKDIKDYEGLYMVSSLGRVKSLERIDDNNHLVKEKILKLSKYDSGYLFVQLSKHHIIKGCLVHRLVCESFIPNPENKPQVDHINTIRDDNRVENLRWVTAKENKNNPLTIKKQPKPHLGKLGKNHPASIPIIQLTTDGKVVKKWESTSSAERELGIHNCCINRVLKGTREQTGGFKWEYYDTDRYLIALLNQNMKANGFNIRNATQPNVNRNQNKAI